MGGFPWPARHPPCLAARCVTGTPLSRGLEDLYGLLAFLQVRSASGLRYTGSGGVRASPGLWPIAAGAPHPPAPLLRRRPQAAPYSNRHWWHRAVQAPYEAGSRAGACACLPLLASAPPGGVLSEHGTSFHHTGRYFGSLPALHAVPPAARARLLRLLRPALGGLLWRSAKADVAHELGLPPQVRARWGGLAKGWDCPWHSRSKYGPAFADSPSRTCAYNRLPKTCAYNRLPNTCASPPAAPQHHHLTRLQLSAIERHFYRRQHQDCVDRARAALSPQLLAAAAAAAAAQDGVVEEVVEAEPATEAAAAGGGSGGATGGGGGAQGVPPQQPAAAGQPAFEDRALSRREEASLLHPLLRLRQACCHPQASAPARAVCWPAPGSGGLGRRRPAAVARARATCTRRCLTPSPRAPLLQVGGGGIKAVVHQRAPMTMGEVRLEGDRPPRLSGRALGRCKACSLLLRCAWSQRFVEAEACPCRP